MVQPLVLSAVNIPETPEYYLKSASRLLFYQLQLWDLTRKEKLKPASLNGAIFSSNLWRNVYSTARVPGEEFDQVVSHFKTVREGKTPTHFIIIGNGRIFIGDSLNPNGSLRTAEQFYKLLQIIHQELDTPTNDSPPKVPILTCDDRTSWYHVRIKLF